MLCEANADLTNRVHGEPAIEIADKLDWHSDVRDTLRFYDVVSHMENHSSNLLEKLQATPRGVYRVHSRVGTVCNVATEGSCRLG